MQTSLPNCASLFILFVGFSSTNTSPASAQAFTILHTLTQTSASGPYTNGDGAGLSAELLLSGDRLYGTAVGGGQWGNGTVFALSVDGTVFTTLHSFSAASDSLSNVKNNDGANPYAGLILSGNTLYGTAEYGGTYGNGAVFAIKTDGTGFTNLHSFTALNANDLSNGDGANPHAGLMLSSNVLYGTTVNGGTHAYGSVFGVSTDGTSFTNLHNFFDLHDGANPYAGLIISGNTLYGTTLRGGLYGNGAVFAMRTDGTGFTDLHSFKVGDGFNPFAGLVLSGNTLYGTTENGGRNNYGTVFAVNTNGTGFTNLYNFNGSDGFAPQASLILSGNTLYGTTTYGGNAGNGTVFAINTDGTGFAILHGFTATVGTKGGYGINSDGGYPVGGVILLGNTLYGTTHIGGSSGSGTLFSLLLPPPQLRITRSAANLNLTWPTNA